MPPEHPDRILPDAVAELFERETGLPTADRFLDSLRSLPSESASTAIELLEELASHSPKAAAQCLRGWSAASGRFTPPNLILWLDLGASMASQSATAALKYFKESLPCLERVSPERVGPVLETALELVDRNYGVIPDYLAAAPEVTRLIPEDALRPWADAGIRLAEADIVLAVEYFRITPALLNFISPQALDPWVRLGMKLVVPNQFGKPDYIRAIEFFRMSPVIFSAVSPAEIRGPFIELAHRLTAESPARALEFIHAGAEILRTVTPPEVRMHVLRQGLRLSERDPAIVTDYLRQSPAILDLVKGHVAEFDRWVNTGYQLVSESLEKARAYFARRSRMSQQMTERLAGGLSLPQVARVLQLFAEGLSGRTVRIRSSGELPEHLRGQAGSRPATDGRIIYLPERIGYFPESRDNFRFYKVATLHEIGHLEFGTYDPDFSSIRDLIEDVRSRYSRPPIPETETGFDSLFSLYPDPRLARSLWETLEDARTDFLLRWRYPGVRRDMDRMVAFELQSRPSLEGLPPRRAVLEALIQLSVTDDTEVPLEMAELISKAYDLLLRMKHPEAAIEDSLRLLDPLYRLVDEWLAGRPSTGGETDPLRKREENIREEASDSDRKPPRGEEAVAFSYRGLMDPEGVRSNRLQESGGGGAPPAAAGEAPSSSETLSGGLAAAAASRSESDDKEQPVEGSAQTVPKDEPAEAEERVFHYDEWDALAQDYRPRYVRLVEKSPAEQDSLFAQETVGRYSGTVKLLRRYFATLRPEALRKSKRQLDGEELDLDALLSARIEAAAGGAHPDRVYIKTEKRERSVAVAFLIDLSGSTSRYIGRTGKKVIEVEKEGLVLLSEALQAVGDSFGIYGFSGKGPQQVEFFILKDFHEEARPALARRIGAVQPMAQNRDGAAIRHCIQKLLGQPARTRLLILLSDGRPLDSGYSGEQALRDTKTALREARIKGIHPYCITIDRGANEYLADMYGEVRYTIIDNVLSLPQRMPQIYRKLTT